VEEAEEGFLMGLGSRGAVMIRGTAVQIVLSINRQDCTIGDGNTVEELEAIAVGLLRTAQALRKHEIGAVEVNNLMQAAIVPDLPEYDEWNPETLEIFKVAGAGAEGIFAFRQIGDGLIESYRRVQNRK
jgi:hypothetical protein